MADRFKGSIHGICDLSLSKLKRLCKTYQVYKPTLLLLFAALNILLLCAIISTNRHEDRNCLIQNSWIPRCERMSVSSDLHCLVHLVKKRVPKGSNLIIAQVNKGFKVTHNRFIHMAMNLICSAESVGISRSQFLIWSMDSETHAFMENNKILSIYNPIIFYGTSEAVGYHSKAYNQMMRERCIVLIITAKFWRLIHSLGINFWWVDADAIIGRNIQELLLRPDAIASDIIFQM
jgi:Nucleotide-diphospho-sugar transferase